jgi:N-acetylneuraminic acid mutarotase
MGGLDAADSSVSSVFRILPGPVSPIGSLSLPTHDAAAAALGGSVYLFGGGHLTSYRTIERLDPRTGATKTVAELPSPLSDVSVAVVSNTAYIVGGYTGSVFSDRILSFARGRVRIAGHLPVGLRYTAVAASGGSLLIAGGLSTAGPTQNIYRFSPADARVRKIGMLPHPLMHAGAAALHSEMCIVGGLGKRLQPYGQILCVGANGAVHVAGSLPEPLSDAGVAAEGGRLIVVGGRSQNGPVSNLLSIEPQP